MVSFASKLAIAQLVVDAGNDVTICKGNSIDIGGNLSASGGNEPYSYSWSPMSFINNPGIANPTVSPKNTSKYYLTVTDNLGNVDTDSVIVFVDSLSANGSCNPLLFYNTFTPNDDGTNDTWVIENARKYPNNTLEVYNRYGKIVYKAVAYDNSWNGRNLGEKLPMATYYYIFDPGDGSQILKGSVTIIR